MPSYSPIDHTFRFYEPEESHYQISLPPFLQMSSPGITFAVSNPDCKA